MSRYMGADRHTQSATLLATIRWMMKISSLSLLLPVSVCSSAAQTPPPASFVTSHLVATGSANNTVDDIAVGDMNGDGIPDLVTAGNSNNNAGVSVLLANGDGTFAQSSFVSTASYTALRAISLGDFNHDGHLDVALLVATQPANLYIFLGDGKGNLGSPVAYPVGNAGASHYNNIAVADLNGDGKLDLAVTNFNDGTISVLMGNGDGTFQAQVTYSTGSQTGPVWVAVGDINKDGKPDLVVASYAQTSVAVICVLLNNGNGTFGSPINTPGPYQANGVVLADLNGDGKLDAVTSSDGSWNGITVFLGNGDGTFQPPVGYYAPYASSVAIADVNNDKKSDLIVSDWNDSTTWILMGKGDGTFKPGVPYATDWGDQGLAVADFNKDGKIDFAVGSEQGYFVTVALGNGDGTFRAGTNYGFSEGYQVYNIVAADVNRDGSLDIVESDPSNWQVLVLLGSSHGVLGTPSVAATLPCQNTWVDVGDVNGDGKPDIVTILSGGGGCGNNSLAAVLLGNGNGTFQAPVYYTNSDGSQPSVVKLADVNGDKKLDMLISNSDGSLSVLLNNGNGTFGGSTVITGVTAGGEYILTGDFNGDGKVDLALPDYSNSTVKVLLGNGNGTFQPPLSVSGVPEGPTGLAAADFNKDGKLDLAVASYSIGNGGSYGGGGVQIFLGNGDGTFTPGGVYGWPMGSLGLGAPSTSPGEPTLADINQDGNLDLLVPLGNPHIWTTCNCGIEAGNDGLAVLLGNGDGTFLSDPDGPFIVGRTSSGVVTGDFNSDGVIDAAVLENNGAGATYVTMLINNTQPVSVSPLQIKYGPQKVGTSSAPRTVVLTNNQAASLTISGVTMGGTDAADFLDKSACPATLKSGASCTVTVTFKPTATGKRSASLVISDAVGTQTTVLTGTGQ